MAAATAWVRVTAVTADPHRGVIEWGTCASQLSVIDELGLRRPRPKVGRGGGLAAMTHRIWSQRGGEANIVWAGSAAHRRQRDRGGEGGVVGREDEPDSGHTRQLVDIFLQQGSCSKRVMLQPLKKEQPRKKKIILQQRACCNCKKVLVAKESCYSRLEKKNNLTKKVMFAICNKGFVAIATRLLLRWGNKEEGHTHHRSDGYILT